MISLNLDRVKDLGSFVEIEVIVDKKDKQKNSKLRTLNLLGKLVYLIRRWKRKHI